MLKKKLKPLIIRSSSKTRFKKIIFLDRDGVINRFPGIGSYVTDLRDFHWLSGARNGIQYLNKAGFEIHLISNQGCVSRGLISMKNLRLLTRRMLTEIRKTGGDIHGIFYCVHQMSDGCRCKKPNVTLFKKALRGRKFDLTRVFFIGDSKEDMQAAKNLGCRALLVLSGRTIKKDLENFEPKPDFVKKNLLEATRWIIRKKF